MNVFVSILKNLSSLAPLFCFPCGVNAVEWVSLLILGCCVYISPSVVCQMACKQDSKSMVFEKGSRINILRGCEKDVDW